MRQRRIWFIAFIILVIGIAAARLALAPWLTHKFNQQLANMGPYHGHLDGVNIQFFQGAYQLRNLAITKTHNHHQLPFFRADSIAVSFSWRALWHGAIVADMAMQRPQLNFVDARKKQDEQAGLGTNWREQIESLSPLTINRLELANGTLAFHNVDSSPQVHLQLKHLNATLTNLTNVDDQQGRVANLELRGLLLDDTPMQLTAHFDPFQRADFDVAFKTQQLPLTALNDFARVYGNLDFKGGHGEVVAELTARDNNLDGYIKPLFQDVDVFDWEQDVEHGDNNPFQIAWQGLAGGLSSLFTNDKTKQLATRIPISGHIEDTEIGTGPAIWGLIKNSFIDAFDDQFEHQL